MSALRDTEFRGKVTFYYLSDDFRNEKNQTELTYLSELGRVVLVTTLPLDKSLAFRHKIISPLGKNLFLLHTVWRRFCFFVCRLADSGADRSFSVRNIYFRPNWIRVIINNLWSLKKIRLVNCLLPDYDFLYFAPYRLYWLYKHFVIGNLRRLSVLSGENKESRQVRRNRFIVHDALLVRLDHFTPLVSLARLRNWPTLAIVKSWDNPFYSQLATGNDIYAVWSENMAKDIFSSYPWMPRKLYFSWGARPYHHFWTTVQGIDRSEENFGNGCQIARKNDTNSFVIGYAAAFCHPIMAVQEVNLIINFVRVLKTYIPNVKFLFRPYPSVDVSTYKDLLEEGAIELISISGPTTDRFGDGREKIKFGSSKERVVFLNNCDLFLSLATSFTFEAAIYGLPIVQYYIPEALRRTSSERLVFEQVDISDHLIKYCLGELSLVKSAHQLALLIKDMAHPCLDTPGAVESGSCIKSAASMLEKIGVPDNWNDTRVAKKMLGIK